MKIVKLCCLSLGLFTHQALALTFTWPVPSSVTITRVGENSLRYDIDVTHITVTDNTLTQDMTLRELFELKGMPMGSRTYTSWFPYVHGTNQAISQILHDITFPYSTTLGDALDRLSQQTTVAFHTHYQEASPCVGAGLMSDTSIGGMSWSQIEQRIWNAGFPVSNTCITPPPPDEWCAMITPTVTFDYGTLSIEEAAGQTRSKPVEVHCTSGIAYTLKLRGLETIALSNGMHAELTANEKKLGSTLQGNTGTNTINLVSTLTGEPQTTGAFSGNGVLYINYP